MKRFENKVVLVTGGGSGIGLETALAFSREGAKVAICTLTESGAKACSRIQQEGGDALFMQCDVTSHSSQKAFTEKIISTYGRLDFAINNAGIEQPATRIVDLDEALWQKVINTNLTGVWLGMKEQIPRMMRQDGGGVIVNVSSIAGMKALENMSAYGASKAAVISLTQIAALEYASHGIRVNAVCPGPVLTAMMQRFEEENPEFFREKILDSIPMKRIAKPEEVAKGILWLCSDDAAFMTGQCLVLDGGLCAL